MGTQDDETVPSDTHEAHPEWSTAQTYDKCRICGDPVVRVHGVWAHET